MEDFFDNVVDAGVTRAILFAADNQGCIINQTINPSDWDKTSHPFQNEQKGQSFLQDDGKITFMEVPMTAKLLLPLTRQTEDAAQARSWRIREDI